MSAPYPQLTQLFTNLSQGAMGRFDGYNGFAWHNLNSDGGVPTPAVQTLSATQLSIVGNYSYFNGSGDIVLYLTISSSDYTCQLDLAMGGPYGSGGFSLSGTYSLGSEVQWRSVNVVLSDGSTATITPFPAKHSWYTGVMVQWSGGPSFCFEDLNSADAVPAGANDAERPSPIG